MSRFVAIACLFACLQIFGFNSAMAHNHVPVQDSTRKDTVEARPVEVEAEQPHISNAPVRTENITSRDLTRAACCSLAESFEKSPTVEVSFADPVSGARQIRMLGLSGLYTQILIEAVPLIRSLEMPYGLDHLPGPFLESVSISKGAATVTTGYEGMTGQLNVCMQDPMIADALFVNAYANTNARLELNVTAAQHLSDELSTMTYGHARMMQQEYDNNNDGFLDMPKFKQLNLVHRWRFNDEQTEFQFFVRGILDSYESGETENSINRKLESDPSYKSYATSTDIERIDGYVKIGLINPFESMEEGSGASLIVSGVAHNSVAKFGNRTIDARQRTMQLRGVVATPFTEEIKFISGATFTYDNVAENMQVGLGSTPPLPNDPPPLPGDGAPVHLSRIEQVPGVYTELTVQPLEPLTIIVGARVDWHNLYGTFYTPRFHAKWAITDYTSIRGSVGAGTRVASVLTENISSYLNSRALHFDEMFRPEKSVNAGVSFTTSFDISERPFTFDVELYRTEFSDQIGIDYDRSAQDLWVTNLSGKSFATHVMAQLAFAPIERLDLMIAYRWLDVQAPYNGVVQQKPFTSRDRILFTATYITEDNEWQADATVVWNGSGRMPSTQSNPEAYRKADTYPDYTRINAQITKRFGTWELYLGSENITNFIQQDPIIAADDPFGKYFDASLAWGPTDPRMVYVGVRYRIE